MEAKLDAVLTALKILTERIESLEYKFDNFENKFEKLNKKTEEQDDRITELEVAVQAKVGYKEYYELLGRIETLEKEALQWESYSKRLNLLIHGLNGKEDSNIWETKEQTTKIFNDFMIKGLQLDPATIPLIDIHRLPQHPIQKHDKAVTRPIIIKLANTMDKQTILKNLKNLKDYNNDRKLQFELSSCREKAQQVYITEHLPKIFYYQKKKLNSKFKEARKAGNKTRWGISNGCYCLFINDNKVTP